MGTNKNKAEGMEMKSRAFIFTGIAFLLIIPAIILVASLLAISDIGSKSTYVHLKGGKTFSVFETAEKDLDRAIDIAGRRAVIAAADYILTYGECLNSSTYNNAVYGSGAEGAIRELILTGNLTSVNHGVFSSLVTQGSTLQDWLREFPERAEALGFYVEITISPDDINITPVNETWYYVTMHAHAIIRDLGYTWLYNGTIPRKGNTTRLISGEGINTNVFLCEEEEEEEIPYSNITYPGNNSLLSCNSTMINGSAWNDDITNVRVNINGTWYDANLTNPGEDYTEWYIYWQATREWKL